MDFKAFRRERRDHLFAPLHQNHRVLAGILKFLVQAERFELVEQAPDRILPGRVGVAAETVGVDVHEMGRRTVGEPPVQFAGDGEGRRDDRFPDAQSPAESLREGGLPGAERPGQQQHVAALHGVRDTLAERAHVLVGRHGDGAFVHVLLLGMAHAAPATCPCG